MFSVLNQILFHRMNAESKIPVWCSGLKQNAMFHWKNQIFCFFYAFIFNNYAFIYSSALTSEY